MKIYLSEILPRLKKFSNSLDQTSVLVDKPWVVKAGNNDYQKLIFKSDGTLLLSRNGDLTDGKWEYISGANSIVIDYGTSKVLYRHSYLDDAVLALKKDGAYTDKDGEIFLLANENVIPDADAVDYLYNKYLTDNNCINLKLDDGRRLIFEGDDWNRKISTISEIQDDGVYQSADELSRYLIQEGKLKSTKSKIQIAKNVSIWNENGWIPRVGDIVVGANSGDFKFKISGAKYRITIENGKISNIIDYYERTTKFILLGFTLAILITIIFFWIIG